jgi:hypothetical protein
MIKKYVTPEFLRGIDDEDDDAPQRPAWPRFAEAGPSRQIPRKNQGSSPLIAPKQGGPGPRRPAPKRHASAKPNVRPPILPSSDHNVRSPKRTVPPNPAQRSPEDPTNSPPRKGFRKLGTVEDLAKRWSLSPKTIRNNLSSGRLKLGSKILGRHRFDIEEVRAYERENQIADKDAPTQGKPRHGGAK